MSEKPRIFIGSSAEGEKIAVNLQAVFDRSGFCESTLWSQGVFSAGQYTLDQLTLAAQDSDFAILVMSPDDLVTSRDQSTYAPRDNIVLELGIFIGALGRERSLFLSTDNIPVKLPSDLAGITRLAYSHR